MTKVSYGAPARVGRLIFRGWLFSLKSLTQSSFFILV